MPKAIFIFLLFFVCCNSKPQTDISQILPKENMVKIMTAMYIVDASVMINKVRGDSVSIYFKNNYNQIFINNNTTPKQFNESLKYYCKNPTLLENINNQINIELKNKN